MSKLNYTKPHYCPVYKKVIYIDLCYDSLMALSGSFKTSSVKEMQDVNDIDNAKLICKKCKYSDL